MKLESGNVIELGSGARVLYVGGNANNGGKCGVGYVNVNNTLSNANANIGARLATKALVFYLDNVSPYLSTVNRGSPTKTLVPRKNKLERVGQAYAQQ